MFVFDPPRDFWWCDNAAMGNLKPEAILLGEEDTEKYARADKTASQSAFDFTLTNWYEWELLIAKSENSYVHK